MNATKQLFDKECGFAESWRYYFPLWGIDHGDNFGFWHIWDHRYDLSNHTQEMTDK